MYTFQPKFLRDPFIRRKCYIIIFNCSIFLVLLKKIILVNGISVITRGSISSVVNLYPFTTSYHVKPHLALTIKNSIETLIPKSPHDFLVLDICNCTLKYLWSKVGHRKIFLLLRLNVELKL